jgi:hypothetical protein
MSYQVLSNWAFPGAMMKRLLHLFCCLSFALTPALQPALADGIADQAAFDALLVPEVGRCVEQFEAFSGDLTLARTEKLSLERGQYTAYGFTKTNNPCNEVRPGTACGAEITVLNLDISRRESTKDTCLTKGTCQTNTAIAPIKAEATWDCQVTDTPRIECPQSMPPENSYACQLSRAVKNQYGNVLRCGELKCKACESPIRPGYACKLKAKGVAGRVCPKYACTPCKKPVPKPGHACTPIVNLAGSVRFDTTLSVWNDGSCPKYDCHPIIKSCPVLRPPNNGQVCRLTQPERDSAGNIVKCGVLVCKPKPPVCKAIACQSLKAGYRYSVEPKFVNGCQTTCGTQVKK